MKIIFLFIFICTAQQDITAQPKYEDSLKKAFQLAEADSSKVFTLCRLSYYYSFLYPDSAMLYAEKAIELSKKQGFAEGEAMSYLAKADAFDRAADFPSALEMAYKSLEMAKTSGTNKLYVMGRANDMIGHLNALTGNNKEAVTYYHESINLTNKSGIHTGAINNTYLELAFAMINLDKPDSALFYMKKGTEFLADVKKFVRNPTPWLMIGNIYNTLGKADSAEHYFYEGLTISEEYNTIFMRTVLYQAIAGIFDQKKKIDSTIYYVNQSLLLSQKYNYRYFEIGASESLAYIYDTVNADSTLKYIKIMVAAKDEVFSEAKLRQFQHLGIEAEKKQRALEDAKARYQNKVKMYALITALGVFLIITFVFWRNNKHKQKANLLLQQQKEKVESTLVDLRFTQAQLIQSEKMASLGQLTAGIAHEIQNPLNFVNNFSEVNTELIDELEQEADKGNLTEVKAIAKDIKENEQKINHHGKRADAIVKGMLQHSRSSSAVVEPTDINKLADEYFKLSYHGLRAKDKTFNATLKTDYDESIGKINIIPQDIGRVLLNVINNAFYAVVEKNKNAPEGYEPTVSITTKKTDQQVEIKVADNGIGIPQKIADKIFEPFFTTKPTGQGTGLGLSLSYDIIKAHGGEIKVNTKEGEGSEFIILLNG